MAKTYICASCGGEFEQGWADEDARAERVEKFGAPKPGEVDDVICDDCYAEFMKWFESLTPEQRAEIERDQ
jgi:hypothetical protein